MFEFSAIKDLARGGYSRNSEGKNTKRAYRKPPYKRAKKISADKKHKKEIYRPLPHQKKSIERNFIPGKKSLQEREEKSKKGLRILQYFRDKRCCNKSSNIQESRHMPNVSA